MRPQDTIWQTGPLADRVDAGNCIEWRRLGIATLLITALAAITFATIDEFTTPNGTSAELDRGAGPMNVRW